MSVNAPLLDKIIVPCQSQLLPAQLPPVARLKKAVSPEFWLAVIWLLHFPVMQSSGYAIFWLLHFLVIASSCLIISRLLHFQVIAFSTGLSLLGYCIFRVERLLSIFRVSSGKTVLSYCRCATAQRVQCADGSSRNWMASRQSSFWIS
jgi:hypothetical protein